jgi:phosphatidylserine/phosphatidylglycerophosphate/cardiolipin synthase-like enzyme
MESDNLTTTVPQVLISAGIPVVGDGGEGLMHNKFMIIDNVEVWTGSMNFTYSGTYEDNNNLIHVHSLEIAQNYTREFEEMFRSHRFGPNAVTDTPHPRVNLSGIPLDVYFSPDDHPQSALLDLISNAKDSIVIMAYSFTSDPLGQAIRDRAIEGITVNGLMDAEQADFNAGGEYLSFRQAGLPILKDTNKGQMHHKVLILDNEIVVIGSYNFTRNADQTNDENLIVVFDPVVADFFMTEYERQLLRANQ